MTEIQNFYSKLYDKNSYNLDERCTDNCLHKVDIKKLSSEHKEILDKQLTRAKLLGDLKTFDRDKTPGNDGLTVEFYLAFWPLLEKCLVDSLNFSHEHGQLTCSQKQAMINLLEKKGKDKRHIDNWRPISLINVDVKIASKALAKRLESILPEIVHHIIRTVLYRENQYLTPLGQLMTY